MNYDFFFFTTAVTILHFVRIQPNSEYFNIFTNICNNMSKCLWCNPPSPLLLHGQTVFFFQVQRSKPPQLIGSLLWQHEFLLRTDFTFHVLWQCVPYSPLLTTSSDPVLFSVYFWDQTVVWSGGLPLFLLSRLEMKEEHRVTLGGPCRRREPQGLLLLVSQLAKFPQRWCKPEEVKRQRSAVDWPL